MKQFAIHNYLGAEMGRVETSLDEDFALALYAARVDAPLNRLKRAHYSAKLICILL